MPEDIFAGMTEVPQREFFRALCTDPRDIMPSNDADTYTDWRVQDRTRELWGRSFPGWKNPGDGPKRWAIKKRS